MPSAPGRTSARDPGLALILGDAGGDPTTVAPGAALLASWHRLRGLPGGRRLFSLLLGRKAPYSGTIGAVVQELEPGHAVLCMADRRAVRNHLDSIHAIALVNLGELASGLALAVDLPAGSRGIVTGIEVVFEKKARGALTATGSAIAPVAADLSMGDVERVATALVRDAQADLVAEVKVRWRIGAALRHGELPLPEGGRPG